MGCGQSHRSLHSLQHQSQIVEAVVNFPQAHVLDVENSAQGSQTVHPFGGKRRSIHGTRRGSGNNCFSCRNRLPGPFIFLGWLFLGLCSWCGIRFVCFQQVPQAVHLLQKLGNHLCSNRSPALSYGTEMGLYRLGHVGHISQSHEKSRAFDGVSCAEQVMDQVAALPLLFQGKQAFL